jgi:putative salt-induced outer membrane protein
MKLLRTLSVLTCALVPAAALAQDKPDGLWHGNFSLGATFASGNSDSTNAGVNFDTARATAQDKLSFYASGAYGENKTGGVKTKSADLLRGGGRYEWNLTPRAFAFGSADLERDGLIDLDLRAVVGGGLGYYVLKEKDVSFQVFGGLAGTTERYGLSTRNRDYAVLILGEESSHALSETTSFKQKLVVYPDLDETGEYRATFDAMLASKLGGNWTLNLSLGARYNSLPPAGTKKTDTVFLVGVGTKF